MWQWAPVAQGQAETCLVATTQGDVRGIDRGSHVNSAQCPSRRHPPARGAGCRQLRRPLGHRLFWMRRLAPRCAAPDQSAGMPAGNEDCLKLNIWAPHAAGRRPSAGHRLASPRFVHSGLRPRRDVRMARDSSRRPMPSSSRPTIASVRSGSSAIERSGERIRITRQRAITGFSISAWRSSGCARISRLRRRSESHHDCGSVGRRPQREPPSRIAAAATGCSIAPSCRAGSHRTDGERGRTARRRVTRLRPRSAAPIPRRCSTCLRAKTPAQVLRALPVGTEQFAETGRTHWGPVVDGLVIPDQPRTLYEIGAFAASRSSSAATATKDGRG